jgi:hypothetical protein
MHNSMADLLSEINNEAETAQSQNETQEKQTQENQNQETTETDESGEPEETDESTESNEGEGEDSEEGEKKPEEKQERKPESRANKRIRELNEAKKLAESRAAQLEAQLRQIEARKAEIDKLADGEKPDPSKFATMQEYLDALTESRVNAALKAAEQNRLKAEQEHAETAYVQEIVGSFEQKVQIAAQANPDLPKAVEHLNKMANYIPVEVRQALLTDENAAQLAWEIATNQELLDYVCMQNPVNSIKVLAKLSAKYDVDEAPAKSATSAPTKPTAFVPTKQAPKVPNVPKSGAGNKSTDNMSPKEYWKAFQAGKVSKPWE